MNKTKIEWCDLTINLVVGCTFNCEYCYARKLNNRFKWINDFSKPQFFPERLEIIEKVKNKIIFMNSMSDIADWSVEACKATYRMMDRNPENVYLFLTKRYLEAEKKFYKYGLCLYGFLGQSITNNNHGLPYGTDMDFISIEPIHDCIDLNAIHTDFTIWIIIGAETGNRKDKIIPKKEWVDNLVNCCDELHIPVFMKDSLIDIVGEYNMRREYPHFNENIEKGNYGLL